MSDDRKKPSGFWEEFRKGHDEQDAKIQADKQSTPERMVEGAVVSATETIFHPVRWLKSLFR